MTQKRIIATPRQLPGALAGMLRMKYEVREPSGAVAAPGEFAAYAHGAEAIFATAFDEMDAGFIRDLPERFLGQATKVFRTLDGVQQRGR